MYSFDSMVKKLKKNPKTIVFTEGSDPRILEAASKLLASNFLTPILLGDPDEITRVAEEDGDNIRGAVIIDPKNYEKMDDVVNAFCEIRKSKGMTPSRHFRSFPRATISAPCWCRWASQTACWAARPIRPRTQSVPHFRSSRPSPATASYPPASSWSVLQRPAAMKSWRWATAPSTFIPTRTSWLRSAMRQQSAQRSSA